MEYTKIASVKGLVLKQTKNGIRSAQIYKCKKQLNNKNYDFTVR